MSLPATPAERSRAHFAHGTVHKQRRFKGRGRGGVTWPMGTPKDDLVHKPYVLEKTMKGSRDGADFIMTYFMDGPYALLFSKMNKYNLKSNPDTTKS